MNMYEATFYNTFDANPELCRIVSVQEVRDRAEARRIAMAWNRHEDRENMVINFVLMHGAVSVI